ncbi:ABC transporter permease [Candidatus Pacearchaeota archaeon]|nr:ABC transporter permease [Candidatus Pacearchaeota archaeon]
MITDYFNIAWKNLRKRKLRSWLTIVGIVISVATIFTLISLSIGLQNAVKEQFETLGGDKFFIQPKGQLGPPQAGGAVQLTINDIDVIDKVTGVKRTAYFTIGNAQIEFEKEKRFFSVYGLPPEFMNLYIETGSFEIDEGRVLKNGDRNKVIIGNHYKTRNIFSTNVKAGDKFIINDKEFEVVGIFKAIGNPDDDRSIIMPRDDFIEMFNSGGRVDAIMVQVDEGADVKAVAEVVEKKLRKFRNVDEKNQDFTILTPEEILAIFGTVLGIITAFLGAIAAISLLVGAIGITNTMYTSVLERTKEIGIMKAVGVKNKDILFIFLIESGLIGLVGGVIGVGLGYSVSKTIELIATQSLGTNLLQAAAPLYLILGCLAFAFLIGSASGTWPAWRASKIKVVDALRYE